MGRAGLDKQTILRTAARLADADGLDQLTLKRLAEELQIKSPSLYNHIGSLDELKTDLMLYGWSEMSEKVLRATAGVSGYDALRALCYAFYSYATEHPGVFQAMLWYNKYRTEEMNRITGDLFAVLYRIFDSVGVSRDNAAHLIRTLRGTLQGFAMLVNNEAFGHPSSVEQSFAMTVQVLTEGIRSFAEPASFT